FCSVFEGGSDDDNVSNEPVIDCVTMAEEQPVLEDEQHYQNGTSTVQGSCEKWKNVLKYCRRRKVKG
ncbi:hypothetical protein RYX36_016162, partial [Vicia faba]